MHQISRHMEEDRCSRKTCIQRPLHPKRTDRGQVQGFRKSWKALLNHPLQTMPNRTKEEDKVVQVHNPIGRDRCNDQLGSAPLEGCKHT